MNANREMALGLLRHILTAFGSVVAAKYGIQEDVMGELVGGCIAALGVIFSLHDKVKRVEG